LLYSSANATVLGIVCNGLEFVAAQSPSLILNQSWYWFAQTWSNPGTQSCNIHAHNSLGEVAVVLFDLVVAPAGNSASGGGTSGMSVYTTGTIDPTGPNASSGRPQGYTDPSTGLVYANPEMTVACGTCNTSAGLVVNVGISSPTSQASTDGGDTGGEGMNSSGGDTGTRGGA
jgi:hypothetical protein